LLFAHDLHDMPDARRSVEVTTLWGIDAPEGK
jgi:hypothetical protein